MTDRPVGQTPNQFNIPVWFRLPLAAALVAWGGRTDRPWTVIVAATVALPALWLYSLSMLVGLVPLAAQSRAGAGPTGAGPA
jgi:hypothetical protein